MNELLPLYGGVLIAIITGAVAYLTMRKQTESLEEIDLRKLGKEMREELRDEIKRRDAIIDAQNLKIQALELLIDSLQARMLALESK